VQAVRAPGVRIVADSRGGGGIVGAMWQMVKSYDPVNEFFTPVAWAGVGGCVGECRPKNLALIDSDGAELRDFSLRDSSDWTTLLRRCSNVLVDGLVTAAEVAPALAAMDQLFYGKPFETWLRQDADRALPGSVPDGVVPMPDGRRSRWPTGDERLDRLVRAWPRILRENWSKVASIDLRYTNGFAVKERTPSALPPKLAKPAKAP
jgi:hypothetical protein